MRRAVTAAFLAGLVVAVPAGHAAAAPASPPAAERQDPAWERLMAAERQFQQELYELLVSKWWPAGAPTFMRSRDLQLALQQERTAKFYYALQHHPERIVRDQGVTAFANNFLIGWTEEDTQRLAQERPELSPLEERVQRLRSENDHDPRWSEAHERLKGLPTDEAYQQALSRLENAVGEAQALLTASPREPPKRAESKRRKR